MQRIEYWNELLKYKPRKKPSKTHNSWIKADEIDAQLLEERSYRNRHKRFLFLVVTAKWDYFYLFCGLIFVFIMCCIYDGYILSAHIIPPSIAAYLQLEMIAIPLVLMTLCQLWVVIGTVILTNYFNDLIRCFARVDLENWVCICIFL